MRPSAEEAHLRVLRVLEAEPEISQRELAKRLGVSLGKANYCIRALLQQGHIKARNFGNSRNRRAYLYKLTPEGVAAKVQATRRFLARKEEEYRRLASEIERMRSDLAQQPNEWQPPSSEVLLARKRVRGEGRGPSRVQGRTPSRISDQYIQPNTKCSESDS